MFLEKLNDSECVPRMIDFFYSPYFVVIVMEMYDLDLLHFIRRTTHPRPTTVFSDILMKKIIFGLSAVHNLGIIHRDLHAKNILVNFRGTYTGDDEEDRKKLLACRTGIL
jgi:serine/threonine protein kinase